MNHHAKPPFVSAEEMTIGALLALLSQHADKRLVFTYEGHAVKPGYHVTEVKTGRFEAIDCGANPEQWEETFIQLWDVDEADGRTHMPAGKFSAIMAKVAETVAIDPAGKLTFEVSDGLRPIQIFRAAPPAVSEDAVRIGLVPRPASCKPRDRWLEQKSTKSACCG